MPSNAQDSNSYGFSNSDRLLVDANVWMFVHGPNKPGDNRVAVYSSGLAKILAAKCTIHTDVLILSEFINRYARLRHSILQSTAGAPAEFKRFRNSADFKAVAQDIADAVRRVLKNCKRIQSDFDTVNIATLIDEYEKGGSDFNDQILIELCKSQGFTFVTDDGDFKASGLNLVTGNKKLLI